jgi:hypothetical protein
MIMTKTNAMRAVLLSCLLLVASSAAMAQRRKTQAAPRDYFPLRVGDSWTYRHMDNTFQFTYKVLSEEKQTDGTLKSILELASSGTLVQYTYTKPKGWVLLHRVTYPDHENLLLEYNPGKQHLKNPLVAGESWRWSGKDIGGNEVSESNQIVRAEWVVVPAGRFHAMKIINKISMGDSASIKTYWYADGVGLIKSTTEAGAISYGYELVDYSFKKGPGK